MLLAVAACSPGTVGEPLPVSTPPDVGGEQMTMPVDSPNTPKAEDGSTLPWPTAATMGEVTYVPNRDSVILVLPEVANARDYRVFRVPAGVTITTMAGGEQVNGTVIHCAGYRQHNDKFTGTRELMRAVEVSDVQGPTTLVVEALDTACPYPGPRGPVHQDVDVTKDLGADAFDFSIWTDDEVRTRFGSLILNGHGPSTSIGAPGPTTPPKVLARTAVKVVPASKATPRTADFFEEFDGTSGAISYVGTSDDDSRAYKPGRHFSNSKWDWFIYNDHHDKAQLSEERGLLHVVLPDWAQDVFATVVMVPRKKVVLSDSAYLHLTFEVASDSTSRRYWWVGLCGPEAGAGSAFDADNHFAGHLVQESFFYEPDGVQTSLEGWNCLQFFPRDGTPFELGTPSVRSQSDLRVMVNKANAPPRTSVVNVSPAQYPDYAAAPSWFRVQDANGTPGAGILDDQLLISPRTRFDAWVKRDRLILYVNGKQRLCNDFPNAKLTQAETAVSVGQVLYHTSAEHLDFSRSFDDRTAQRYYLENTAYVDERDWDNVGFESNVGAPSDFDAAPCYRAP